ncbi:hypothetical protein NC797_06975 [Aquibacillus sp. 3ASR75-11]|uniref:Uncharacterized protein n=1 Tax=Terrihalobacillus insolitus TaxID=2950438 RepID=A0A9X3WR50_9BACI|nr:hypothetical protein [Terrihalobacillus insolitus]MDC3424250.1 hypothetical protein [Terrihalobacillus insolitus]
MGDLINFNSKPRVLELGGRKERREKRRKEFQKEYNKLKQKREEIKKRY